MNRTINAEGYDALIIAAGCSRRLSKLTHSIPKSFLIIQEKPVIKYHLDILHERGFKRAILVVGYLKDFFFREIGSRYRDIQIDYVISEDYENTGQGWSIYLTRSLWEKTRKPVILVHADIFYHPGILDKVMSSKLKNVLGVDDCYEVRTHEEVVILGEDDRVRGVMKGVEKNPAIVGEIIGINKWSEEFMKTFYEYMEIYFKRNGRKCDWEPLLAEFIQEQSIPVHYERCGNFSWININRPNDYLVAQGPIYQAIYGQSISLDEGRYGTNLHK